ncbi:MAG: hypothetical protein ABSF09_02180 [Candidatus Bathyarchaeia archaeon]
MRRLTLTIGLLMIISGLYFMNQSAQILYPLAGATGLIFNVQTQMVILPSTLLTVAPSNYTYLTVELKKGAQTNGRLQVEGGSEIGFYIMNGGNFSEWRHSRPTVIELAKPNAINYNFTFVPRDSGNYYFVFSNQDPTRKNVVLTVSTVETVAVLSPFIQYAGYEALMIGLLLSIVAIKTGKRRPKPTKILEPTNTLDDLKCKFCGARKDLAETFCSKCGRSHS